MDRNTQENDSSSELERPSVFGVILCGGSGSRIGGSKPDHLVKGVPLLQRVVSSVQEHCDEVFLVRSAQHGPAVSAECSKPLTILQDEYPDRGVIEGIRVGLTNGCQKSKFDWNDHSSQSGGADSREPLFWVIGCDYPFVQAGWFSLLRTHLGFASAVIPKTDGKWHVLNAVYQARVLRAIESMIEEGDFRLQNLPIRIDAVAIDESQMELIDPDFKSLLNVNRIEDLESS